MTKDEMVSLREYIDTRIKALEESLRQEQIAGQERALAYKSQSELVADAIEKRFNAIDKATQLASESVDKRLENMNEFRAQLNAQQSHFMTRSEHEQYERRMQILEQTKLGIGAHDALELRIQRVEKTVANLEGRIWAISVGFTVLITAISVALHFIK